MLAYHLNGKRRFAYHRGAIVLLGLVLLLAACGPVRIDEAGLPAAVEPANPAATAEPTAVPLPGPATEVAVLEPSPEALTITQADFDLQPLTLENVADIAPVAVLQDSGLGCRTLSPDGARFAVCHTYSVGVYDTAGGRQTAALPVRESRLLAFSPSGDLLAIMHVLPQPPGAITLRTDKSGSAPVPDRYALSVWDLASGKTLFTHEVIDLCGGRPALDLFRFLDDDTLVLAGLDFDAHTQAVCRIATDGTLLDRFDLPARFGYVRSLAMPADGSTLAAAFSAGPMDYLQPALAVFHYPDGALAFQKSLGQMPALAFGGRGGYLFYNTLDDNGAALIEALGPGGESLQTIALAGRHEMADRFAVNDRYLAVPGETGIVVYPLGDESSPIQFPYVRQAETPFAPEADGYIEVVLAGDAGVLLVQQRCAQAACTNMDDMLRAFDLENQEETARLETRLWYVAQTGGDLSPDGSLAAAAGWWDGSVRLWSTRNGAPSSIQTGGGLVYQAVFSPDSAHLATVSADGAARLWDSQSRALLQTLDAHSGWALRVAFSPDGSRLLTSGEDGMLRLWDLSAGAQLHAFANPQPDGVVDGIWFLSAQTVLLSVSDLQGDCHGCYRAAYLLDLESGAFSAQTGGLLAYDSPDGWLFRSGGYESRVLYTGRVEAGALLMEHSIPLTPLNDSLEIAASPDGRWVFTFNANGLNVIDRASGSPLALALNEQGVLTSGNGRLKAAPDGRFLLDFSSGTTVLWGVPQQ